MRDKDVADALMSARMTLHIEELPVLSKIIAKIATQADNPRAFIHATIPADLPCEDAHPCMGCGSVLHMIEIGRV